MGECFISGPNSGSKSMLPCKVLLVVFWYLVVFIWAVLRFLASFKEEMSAIGTLFGSGTAKWVFSPLVLAAYCAQMPNCVSEQKSGPRRADQSIRSSGLLEEILPAWQQKGGCGFHWQIMWPSILLLCPNYRLKPVRLDEFSEWRCVNWACNCVNVCTITQLFF